MFMAASGGGVVAPTPELADPYFDNVELLLHGDGTSGSTTFTDSSPDPKTITVNGNTQIDTAVKKFGTGSIEFDGTNSNLTLASGIIGSGDFTIECFVQGVNSDGYLFDFEGTNRLSIWYEDTTASSAYDYSINVYDTGYRGQTNSLPFATYTGAFNHIAVVRSSGTMKIYINGTSIASWSNSLDYSDATLTIGNTDVSRSSDKWMEGFIDDIRITKGVARYTSDFNPPDVPHPDIASDQYFYATELLIPANGTNGSTTFTDGSSNALTITANGNAQISTTQSKFGGSSGYFDGSGDYLSLSAFDGWGFGNGAWTVEFWINTTDTDFDPIAAFNPSAPYEGWGIRIQNGLVKFFQSDGASSDGHDTVSGTTGVNDGAWHHVALISTSGSNAVSCYIDGTLAGSHTFTVAISTSGQALRVGADTNTSPSRPLNGYIDDLRITKGVVRYTSDFTPPRIEHPDFGTTREAVPITANGNAQISTAQSKFGGSSAYFDGTGDYLTASHPSSFNFGSSDFTAEVWFNVPTGAPSGTEPFIVTAAGQGTNGTDFQGIWFGLYQGQYYFIASSNQSSWDINIGAGTPSTNTWTHFCVVRSGNTFTLYANGVSIGTTTNSGTLTNSNNLVAIGGRTRNNQYSIGYLDDVRISNIARYTSNFTPPTSPFDNDSNTLLLLHMDNPNSSTTFIDDNGLLTSTE
jgi:hypothetical protein